MGETVEVGCSTGHGVRLSAVSVRAARGHARGAREALGAVGVPAVN